VSLRAFVEGEKRSAVQAGITDRASEGIDAIDVEKPPFPVSAVQLHAVVDSGAGPPETMMRDYRPLEENGQRFPLRLTPNGQEMITLRPGEMTVSGRYDVVLVQRSLGRAYDLREDEKVVLQPEASKVPLVLLVGTPAYVEEQKSRLAPDKLKLLGNYPNPVTRSTTIEYGLPEEAHVRLELYDLLGRRIQVLVDEAQRAGFHRVQWRSGSDRSVASGVYFYRLRVDGKSKVKKMTVVR
jgi:hypothetical protein